MPGGGYYLMRRGWLDHEMFQSAKREPFCHRAAWAWLMERAAYAQGAVKGLQIERGQLAATLLDMGGAWGWNTTKVARFLTALRERCLIVTATVNGMTIITICFYEDYQSSEELTVTPTVTPTVATVKRDRYGTKRTKQITLPSEPKGSSDCDARELAEEMVSVWRKECGDVLSVPTKMDAARIAGCDARWKDAFGRDLEQWWAYCRRIRGSPFCCGDNERGWRADFDWALKPKTIRGVMEGKYERRLPPRKASPADNLIEGFGRAAGLRTPDSEPDRSAAGPLLDGEYARLSA